MSDRNQNSLPTDETPVFLLIREFVRLNLQHEGQASRLNEDHETRLRAIDRQYWADTAELEQRYRRAQGEEHERHQRALQEHRNQREADHGRVYRIAQEAEETQAQGEENPQVVELETVEEPQVVIEDPRNLEIVNEPRAIQVQARAVENQQGIIFPPIGARVRVETPVRLARHRHPLHNATGTVLRHTDTYTWIQVWNPITRRNEEFKRKPVNLITLQE